MKQTVPRAEMVVGICTKNCEETIQNVIKKVDEGLSQFYPDKKSLIIVSDLSEDSTKEMVSGVKTRTPVFFTRQDGGPGKGNGIKTIFRLSLSAKARAVALVDGDLLSINSEWVKALIGPVENGFDLAVPYYERHKYDSVITNHIIYPFVTSIYGTEIRQPIGGEFGLSISLVKKLLEHPKFPDGFGIDVFITTSALAEEMRVAETALGIKSHTSTREYRDFESLLIPMFNQVVSTLFDLTLHNKNKLRNVSGVKGVKRFGKIRGGSVAESVVDADVLYSRFLRDYEMVINSDVLSDKTKAQLMDFVSPDNGHVLSVESWVNSVCDAFQCYANPAKRQEVIDVLRIVWMGRLSSFIRQTQLMNNGDVECIIRGQENVFSEKKYEMLKNL